MKRSMSYTIRFVGDPTGYQITTHLDATELVEKKWIPVRVGATSRVVNVDVSKAYLIDAVPA
jgi:hypothetical protein